ncbi:hypothetical protein [Adlercreutzia sp. ZJ154]|uniref:hypothetical protein n=1 Tax=Adlercreutzia sp. ZJ154 TaxID=2709790 RepID=UPI0013EC2BBF|nr:hypothetical protein [Adlercreutzia sp. ZJ154]
MKKTRKLMGAFALSAALAIGCAMPAFAAAGDYDGESPFYGAKTDVFLQGVADSQQQISITVPVNLTLSAPQAGGTITAPSAAAYTITNRGTTPVKVSEVCAILATKTVLSETPLDTSFEKDSENTTIYLTMKTDTLATPVRFMSPDIELILPDGHFDIAGGDSLGITLAGQAYPASSGSFAIDTSVKAVSLEYTVELIN